MARKPIVEVNYAGVGELLRSDSMRTVVKTAAVQIATNAGEGYEHDTKLMGTRVIASAFAATKEAQKDNLENNTLLKAVHL